MKAVTHYEADDGASFRTEAECVHYEALVLEVNNVIAYLPKPPTQDESYIPVPKEIALRVQRELVQIFVRECPNWKNHSHVEYAMTVEIPAGNRCLLGRFMQDCCPVVYAGWWRIMCIDHEFRMWSQPYYANRRG